MKLWSFPLLQNLGFLIIVSYSSHNFLLLPNLFPPSHFTMPFVSPAIITQDDDLCSTMAKPKEPSRPTPVKNSLQLPLFPKKLVQHDLHGNPVPASKLKTKVKSYKKQNGTLVKRHSRKTVDKSIRKTRSRKVLFQSLSKSAGHCKKSLNLAHSLYVEELRSSIYSVGKTAESKPKQK